MPFQIIYQSPNPGIKYEYRIPLPRRASHTPFGGYPPQSPGTAPVGDDGPILGTIKPIKLPLVPLLPQQSAETSGVVRHLSVGPIRRTGVAQDDVTDAFSATSYSRGQPIPPYQRPPTSTGGHFQYPNYSKSRGLPVNHVRFVDGVPVYNISGGLHPGIPAPQGNLGGLPHRHQHQVGGGADSNRWRGVGNPHHQSRVAAHDGGNDSVSSGRKTFSL